MPTKLTKRNVDAAQAGDRDTFLWDTELKGFGLKITKAGRKVYVIQYRMPMPGKPMSKVAPKRYTIGEHGSPWTPEKARDHAGKLLGLVDQGKDPAALERAEREEEENRRKEEEARKKSTLETGLEDFLTRRVRGQLVKAKAVESLLRTKIPTAWLLRQVTDIQADDIQAAIDDMVAANKAGAAREFRKHLNAMFGFFASRPSTYGLAKNPVAHTGVDATYVPGKRALSKDELAEVWRATESLGYPFGPFFQLLILTGQRLREVAEAQWSEFSADGIWTIPGQRCKNGKEHLVHVSPQAKAILDTLPRVPSPDNPDTDSPFLFSTTGRTPISGFSKAKAHLDKAIAQARTKAGNSTTMPPWKPHDLRRTLATGLADKGTAVHVVEKLLNHNPASMGGVAAIYNRYEYLPERKAALEIWGVHVANLLQDTPEKSNVVDFSKSRERG